MNLYSTKVENVLLTLLTTTLSFISLSELTEEEAWTLKGNRLGTIIFSQLCKQIKFRGKSWGNQSVPQCNIQTYKSVQRTFTKQNKICIYFHLYINVSIQIYIHNTLANTGKSDHSRLILHLIFMYMYVIYINIK